MLLNRIIEAKKKPADKEVRLASLLSERIHKQRQLARLTPKMRVSVNSAYCMPTFKNGCIRLFL